MLTLSGTMLVGCTQSEYIGEAPQQNGNEIVFSGASGKMTRATSNTADTDADKLDRQIKFYGVKKTGNTYAKVFEDYVLWFDNANITTSNPDGDWEYVGVKGKGYGTDNTADTLDNDQYIKYWDYSASEYNFVAGSPVKAFTYALEGGEIKTATVTGIAGHLNPNNGEAINTDPIYIAAPVKVAKADYKKDVVFNFTRQQSFVRVGVFETIPGYSVTSINFYKRSNSGWRASAEGTQNIILASSTNSTYFTGSTDAKATITYNWTTPSYTFAYDTSTLNAVQNWFGGALNGVTSKSYTDASIAELYGTDGDMAASTGYFTVIPTATATTADALLIKCDYVLTSDDNSGETIKVTGATAAIPAAYAKWAQNTSYTYLFKISDNTNGTTGEGGPEGLYPITFDAAVVEVEDGTAQGTVTTVSTPSITTYQEGFAVEDNNETTGENEKVMKYVAGKAIYVTVQNDETGELYKLNGKVKVFSLGTTAKTEADLILTAPTTGETTFTVGSGQPVGSVTYEAGMYGAFTPGAAGYYAIQYEYAAGAFAYKVVHVE